MGQGSFTSALIDELRAFGHAPFTVVMLHARLVTMRGRLAYTPFYASLSENSRPSIEIAPLPTGDMSNIENSTSCEESSSAYDPMDTSSQDETTTLSSTQPSSQSSPSSNSGTRVLLAVSISQEADPNIDQWISWLTTQAPWDVTAVDVQVESIYRSHSTLVLISIPTSAWDRLPARAAYQFVGFIRSGNLLPRDSSHKFNSASISPNWNLDTAESTLKLKTKSSANISRAIRSKPPSKTYDLRPRVTRAKAQENSPSKGIGAWPGSVGKVSKTTNIVKTSSLAQRRQSSRIAPRPLASRISPSLSLPANLAGGLSWSSQEDATLLDSQGNIRDNQSDMASHTGSLVPKELPEDPRIGLARATRQVEKHLDVGKGAAGSSRSPTSQSSIRVPLGKTTENSRVLSSEDPIIKPVFDARHEPNKTWGPDEDETLLHARQQGLNWAPIAEQYFPTKTPNACRKRHERLLLKIAAAGDWDSAKIGALAQCYMELREKMWNILAIRINEKWEAVEKKVINYSVR